jgi:hypothetical protein
LPASPKFDRELAITILWISLWSKNTKNNRPHPFLNGKLGVEDGSKASEAFACTLMKGEEFLAFGCHGAVLQLPGHSGIPQIEGEEYHEPFSIEVRGWANQHG